MSGGNDSVLTFQTIFFVITSLFKHVMSEPFVADIKGNYIKGKKKKRRDVLFCSYPGYLPRSMSSNSVIRPFALDVFGFTVHSSSSLVEIPLDKWEGKPNSSFSPPPIPAQEKLLKHKHFSWEGETTKG